MNSGDAASIHEESKQTIALTGSILAIYSDILNDAYVSVTL